MPARLALLACLLLPLSTQANTCLWTGQGGDNSWNNAANWSNCGGSVPQAFDTVVIDDTDAGCLTPGDCPPVQLDVSTASLFTLTLSNGGTLYSGSGNYSLDASNINSNGSAGNAIDLSAGSGAISGQVLSVSSPLTLTLNNSGLSIASAVSLGSSLLIYGTALSNSYMNYIASTGSPSLGLDSGTFSGGVWGAFSPFPLSLQGGAGGTLHALSSTSLTMDSGTTLRLSGTGSVLSSTAPSLAAGSTIVFQPPSGGSSATALPAGFQNLGIAGTGTVSAASNLDVNGNFTQSGTGAFNLNAFDLNLAGNFNAGSSGSFNGTGFVILDGSGAQSVNAGSSANFQYFFINKPGGTATLASDFGPVSQFSLYNGALNMAGYTLGGVGHFTNVGNPNLGSGKVVFSSSTLHAVSGTSTFDILSFTATSDSSLFLPHNLTQTVTGTLSLHAAPGQTLNLYSGLSGVRAALNATGARSLGRLNVQDSHALSPIDAAGLNCTDAGNNLNWTFAYTPTASPSPTASPADSPSPTASPTATPTDSGTATPTHTPSATPSSSFTASPTVTQTLAPDRLIVNMGGGPFAASDGYTYQDDSAAVYTTGTFCNPFEETCCAVSGTVDDPLYINGRYGPQFNVVVPLRPGSYQVLLRFNDPYNIPGARVFDVSLNGSLAYDNLDCDALAGNNAAVDLFFDNVSPAAGFLTVSFQGGQLSSTDNNAILNAVRILPQSEAPTPTPTRTHSPTASPTATPTGSPTDTPTHTPSATSSSTSTASPTSTPSLSPTATPSITLTSTPTESFTASPTMAFAYSTVGKAAFGPVPVRAGNPLCLYFEKAPASSRCDIYNSAGQAVGRMAFATEPNPCWQTTGVVPGLYFGHISVNYQDGTHRVTTQKLVVVK